MARSEEMWMDEHMIVTGGSIGRLKHDFIHENHKGLMLWIDKHNRYSDRDIMSNDMSSRESTRQCAGGATARKRFLKNAIYGRAPLFLRAIAYGFLRYFILLGFLVGRVGFVFHFLQRFWYRLIIDAKIYERRLKRRLNKLSRDGTEPDTRNKPVPVRDGL
jgi:hypothetical protein